MATQRERNFNNEGKSSFIGKDPFDGLLKNAMTKLGIILPTQTIYLKQINDILLKDPNSLVGKNPQFIAYALEYGSRLGAYFKVDDAIHLFQKELKFSPHISFTIVRYILWLREMEFISIETDLVPADWAEEVDKTLSLMRPTYSQPLQEELEE